MAFLAELNRIKGGNEGNFDPAFNALRALLPNVGAIAANLGAYATLWQQEQVDIAPYNFNFVQTLKGKGVPVEFVVPDTGLVGWSTSLHLCKNAAEPDLAVQYIDSHLAAEVQADMLIAEKCANRSSPPPSGVMNPKPFASLNHFTVPVAISGNSSSTS